MVIRLRWSGLSGSIDQAYRHAALGGEERGVHVGDLLLDDVGEDALEGGELEHLDVVVGDLAAHLDVDLLGDLAGQAGEDPAELLGQRDAGADVLGDHAALHVDRVGHQLAGRARAAPSGRRRCRPSPGPRRSRRRGAGWRRRSRARRAGCRCTARSAKTSRPAAATRPSLRAAYSAGSSTMPPRAALTSTSDGLTLRELLGADQADGLGRLGQVHGHEVGLGEQRVEVDEPHAHLGGAAGLHVGVVGDDLHAERREPLGDEHADPAEADDADGLLVELDAGVARALPLAVLERGVRRARRGGPRRASARRRARRRRRCWRSAR